jgi:hypothetical protein
MKSSSCALLALILALILGGAYYFYTQKDLDQKNNQPLTSQESISESDKSEDSIGPTVLEPEKIKLADVSGGEGQGSANRIYSSNKFIHTITAQLSDPVNGSFYAGWLINLSSANQETISTGKLEKNGTDYYLEFISKTDYSLYNKVIITLQDQENSQPGKSILEGQFK